MRGTSGHPTIVNGWWSSSKRLSGYPKRSGMGGLATGSKTISTGRSRGSASGERPYRSGPTARRITIVWALSPNSNCYRVASCPASIYIGPQSTMSHSRRMAGRGGVFPRSSTAGSTLVQCPMRSGTTPSKIRRLSSNIFRQTTSVRRSTRPGAGSTHCTRLRHWYRTALPSETVFAST